LYVGGAGIAVVPKGIDRKVFAEYRMGVEV
jgi:hypothetical protein